MPVMRPNDEMEGEAQFLEGMAAVYEHSGQHEAATTLQGAAKWLRKAARSICAQGYFGCRGGPECTSSHK